MASEIRFGDGTILRDQTIMICDGFLAVIGENDSLSLYNLNSVEALIEVQNIQPGPKKTPPVISWP